uniref:Putative phosphatidylinositol transfer protein sec14 n=1 Tax=Haematobia irritans TaxID=7368 RepID=A0A1L8EG33_HAEIR
MEVKGDKEQEKIIDDLQAWFEENPNLPNKIDRLLLTRFYYCMHKDVEKTQKLLETNYSMRLANPKIFIDRDPLDQDTKNTMDYADIIPLPGLTPNDFRIVLHHINNPDPKLMHHAEDTKTYMLLNDCRFSLPDAIVNGIPVLAKGDIHITDMACNTMGHMRQMSFGILRLMLKFLQEAYPIRIRAIHMINCPSYMNKILAVVRPFVHKRVFELMHFHTDGLEGLYEHVPKEMLPEEYGGNAGTIAELKEKYFATVIEKRDYLMDPDYWSK